MTKRKLHLWLITTKPYTKFQLNKSKHDKKRQNWIVTIFLVQKGALLIQNRTECHKTLTWFVANHYKAIYKISAQYLKAWRKKVHKTELLRYSKSKKGHNSLKIWWNLTKREWICGSLLKRHIQNFSWKLICYGRTETGRTDGMSRYYIPSRQLCWPRG